MRTPWGESDHVRVIAEGITEVGTSSHGGILLSPERHDNLLARFDGFQTYAGGAWYMQTWDGHERVHSDLAGLTLDAAREVALAHLALGYTPRILCEQTDYVEVYSPSRGLRSGPFAEVTLVSVTA